MSLKKHQSQQATPSLNMPKGEDGEPLEITPLKKSNRSSSFNYSHQGSSRKDSNHHLQEVVGGAGDIKRHTEEKDMSKRKTTRLERKLDEDERLVMQGFSEIVLGKNTEKYAKNLVRTTTKRDH